MERSDKIVREGDNEKWPGVLALAIGSRLGLAFSAGDSITQTEGEKARSVITSVWRMRW